MPKPDNVNCGNCIYWDRKVEGYGLCRRYPRALDFHPKMFTAIRHIARHTATLSSLTLVDIDEMAEDIEGDGAQMRPETAYFDWCGEFRSTWPENV